MTEIYRYADNTLSGIQHVDVTNPLSTIVYQADYGSISYLDVTLALIRTQRLQEWDLYNISTIGVANDGNLWLYDPVQHVIAKYDDTGRRLLSSNRLSDFGINSLEPVKIIERANLLLVYDPSIGILVLDNLGQYIKLLPLVGFTQFQSDGSNIYLYQSNQLKAYTIRLLEEKLIYETPLSNLGVQHVLVSPKSYILIYRDGIDKIPRG